MINYKGAFLLAITLSSILCEEASNLTKFNQIESTITAINDVDALVEQYFNQETSPSKSFRFLEGGPNVFSKLMSSIIPGLDYWNQAVQVLRTTRSNVIKQQLVGKGFTHFSQSAQVQVSRGIRAEHVEKFFASVIRRIQVPENRRGDVEDVIEQSEYMGSNTWMAFDTLFSTNDQGKTKFASILINKNESKNTYDVVMSDIKATFKLAPDVIIMTKSLSVGGGIFTDTKDERTEVPKSLTQDDVKAVMDFFHIVAVKSFCDHFGVKLDLPKIK